MFEDLPTTRKAAKAAGARHYYCGPCEAGHDVPRFTSSDQCVRCSTLRTAPVAAFQRRLQRAVVAHLGVPVETLMALPQEHLATVLAERRP